MRTTIDQAGRLVVPRALRDQVGMSAGAVEVTVVGSALHIEPVVSDQVIEQNGRLVIAADGPETSAEDIRELRLADQK
jgi:bifunctional DNA-binding transcriptional regulator/antitoxin component of YhaV-PrlF toxin-antitoxin module